MTRKKLLIGIGSAVAIVLLVGVGIFAVQRFQKKSDAPSPVVQSGGDQVKKPSLVLWDDPAGFTFQYPEGMTVDKHDEDKENYAHVELTDTKHPGKIIVWAKDTKAADVQAWVKTEKSFADGSILDTTLGNQPAKKVLLTAPEKKLVVGTVYDSLLFTIEGTLTDEAYWNDIATTVGDSFVFKPLPGEKAPTSSGAMTGGGDDEVVEEEVVE